jgi:hypothetical protein
MHEPAPPARQSYFRFAAIESVVSLIFFKMFDKVDISLLRRSIAICNLRLSASPSSLIESKSFFMPTMASSISFCDVKES